jgi:D-beta-D-heptose 7-phosphate kinase/D-beta-D-heptose 1-phosphate adenosyltransferase
LRDQIGRSDICVVSDYQKVAISRRVAQAAIQSAHGAGVPVVVDPKSRDFSLYRGATVVTPNLPEAERAANRECNGNRDLVLITRGLLRLLDGAAPLVTRGAEGMPLFRRGLPPVHIPTEAHNVFDVTGAGDTAGGTLALAIAAGLPLEEAAFAANAAAGLVVGKVGTATVTPDELNMTPLLFSRVNQPLPCGRGSANVLSRDRKGADAQLFMTLCLKTALAAQRRPGMGSRLPETTSCRASSG